jgi:hypothetical protein
MKNAQRVRESLLGYLAEKGIRILKETGVDNEDLRIVKELMSKWYASYENLCQKEVVKNRPQIGVNHLASK